MSHGFLEFALDRVEVRDQIVTGLLDSLAWFLLAGCLALNLDTIFEWMRLAIASEFHGLISEELVPDDIAQGMVLVLDAHNREVDFLLVYGHFFAIQAIAEHFNHLLNNLFVVIIFIYLLLI